MVNPLFIDTRSIAMVDAMNLLLRIYFSVFKGNPIKPVNELLESCCQIFMHQISLVVRKYSCDRIYVVFDHGGSARKRAILESYKATRQVKVVGGALPTEDTCEDVFSLLKSQVLRLCHSFNIPVFCEYGIEADDMIGIAVEEFSKLGKRVVILSNDSDFLQLLSNPNVLCAIPAKDVLLTGADFCSYFASQTKSKGVYISPTEYLFYKALVGDTSDNIDGISRLGYKTLYKLMEEQMTSEAQEYRTLYASDTLAYVDILASRGSQPNATKLESLVALNIDLIRRNYKLIELSSNTASPSTIHATLQCLKTAYPVPSKKSVMTDYSELFPTTTARVLEFVTNILTSLAPVYR